MGSLLSGAQRPPTYATELRFCVRESASTFEICVRMSVNGEFCWEWDCAFVNCSAQVTTCAARVSEGDARRAPAPGIGQDAARQGHRIVGATRRSASCQQDAGVEKQSHFPSRKRRMSASSSASHESSCFCENSRGSGRPRSARSRAARKSNSSCFCSVGSRSAAASIS